MKPLRKNPSVSEIETAASAWIARRDAGMTRAEELEFMHWSSDLRHAAALAAQEQTWKMFERPSSIGQGRMLADEFRARFARQRRRRIATSLTAVSFLFVAALVWRTARFGMVEGAPVANAIVKVPETRTLLDGTVVELNSGAEVAIDYSGPFRRVALRKGEAHFQVAENPARPFIVDVEGVEVRAVGTAFSVQLSRQSVEVLVTHGKVAVEPVRPSPGSVRIAESGATPAAGLVEAGHRVVVELAPETATPPVPIPFSAGEMAERMAWRAPRLEFTAAPLLEAVSLMNRYNRAQFVIDDPAIGTLEVSGYFRADNFETFLTLIEQGLGLRSERIGDKIILRRSR
jgi:transmembrane sensor